MFGETDNTNFQRVQSRLFSIELILEVVIYVGHDGEFPQILLDEKNVVIFYRFRVFFPRIEKV